MCQGPEMCRNKFGFAVLKESNVSGSQRVRGTAIKLILEKETLFTSCWALLAKFGLDQMESHLKGFRKEKDMVK